MSRGKRVGYIRVSTVDQNTARQLEGIELDEIFLDKHTGTTIDRPKLQAMLQYVRKDDIVYVHSLDRLARNQKDVLDIITQLLDKEVQVNFIKESISLK